MMVIVVFVTDSLSELDTNNRSETRVRPCSAEAQLEGNVNHTYYINKNLDENILYSDNVEGDVSLMLSYDDDDVIPPGFVKVQVESDDEHVNNISIPDTDETSMVPQPNHDVVQVISC